MKEGNEMYYLRKESYEQVIPEIKKTDGTLIPERKYMTDDRALYKGSTGRLYRGQYPKPRQKGLTLYKVKKLTTIFEQRERLHEYCGEWFDVYDESGKVNITNVLGNESNMDELREKAIDLLKKYPENINVDLLRRHLKIGLITANKIIEVLENDSSISKRDESGKRELLI